MSKEKTLLSCVTRLVTTICGERNFLHAQDAPKTHSTAFGRCQCGASVWSAALRAALD